MILEHNKCIQVASPVKVALACSSWPWRMATVMIGAPSGGYIPRWWVETHLYPEQRRVLQGSQAFRPMQDRSARWVQLKPVDKQPDRPDDGHPRHFLQQERPADRNRTSFAIRLSQHCRSDRPTRPPPALLIPSATQQERLTVGTRTYLARPLSQFRGKSDQPGAFAPAELDIFCNKAGAVGQRRSHVLRKMPSAARATDRRHSLLPVQTLLAVGAITRNDLLQKHTHDLWWQDRGVEVVVGKKIHLPPVDKKFFVRPDCGRPQLEPVDSGDWIEAEWVAYTSGSSSRGGYERSASGVCAS
jgi:hypothetical protein